MTTSTKTQDIMSSMPNAKQQAADDISRAKESISEIAANRETSEQRIEQLRKKIREEEAALSAATRAEEAENQRIEQAERLLAEVAPVSLESATAMANRMLECFASKEDDIESQSNRTWQMIDDIRCMLLTQEVADDAKQIVLAMDAIIAACDTWELHRTTGFSERTDGEGTKYSDAKLQALPQRSRLVELLIAELHHVLAGTSPDAPKETIGELISQNVTLNQISLIFGFTQPGGATDTGSLGRLVDRALIRSGFYRDGAKWLHLRRAGAMNAAEAWESRQSSIEAKINTVAGRPGSPASGNFTRSGRTPRAN